MTDRRSQIAMTIHSYLSSLGNNQNLIVSTLKAQSIKGQRGNGEDDPVAVGLHRCLGRRQLITEISVGSDTVYADDDIEIDIPEPIRKFLKDFDDGVYPELVKAEVDTYPSFDYSACRDFSHDHTCNDAEACSV